MASSTAPVRTGPNGHTRPVNNVVGMVFGAVYLLVALLGFAVTGGKGFADPGAGQSLLGFAVNPLHNIVHLLIGALLLGGGALAGARAINGLVGAVYLLVGILGLFIASPDNSVNILALNGADNVLHLASALLLLVVAVAADRGAARGRRVTA